MCIIVSELNITPFVIEGLLKERLNCSMISRATVSLMIVKLGSSWDCASCGVNVTAWFKLIPDISTVEGWIPGPEVTRY